MDSASTRPARAGARGAGGGPGLGVHAGPCAHAPGCWLEGVIGLFLTYCVRSRVHVVLSQPAAPGLAGQPQT